jgi:hypothetical protein
MNKYYICGGADDYWTATNAKTLSGAKAIASRTYQQTVGGKIKVAEAADYGENGIRYIPVAVKYGYDNWQQA